MKKTIITILQIIVTLGILVWVFHNPAKREQMLHALHQVIVNGTWYWFIYGIITYGVVEFLAAIRWNYLLRVQEIFITKTRLVGLLMIGLFFNIFMPGGTGGDVVKAYYLIKETPDKKAAAILSILMDRMIGLLGMMFMAAVFIYWRYDWLTGGASLPPFHFIWLFSPDRMFAWINSMPSNLKWLYLLIFILAFSLLSIISSFIITGTGLANKLPKRMPFRDKFIELSSAYHLYAKAWKSTFIAFVLSCGVHLLSFLEFFFAARAFYHAKVLDYFAIMPIVSTIAAIPISVAGLGVRETLFQDLLGRLCGVPAGTAVMISISGFLLIAFWGVLGGILYMFYRPSEHARLHEIQKEVAAYEHEIAEKE